MRTVPPGWEDYERRVQALEDQGLTRSDAQGVVDAEDMLRARAPQQQRLDLGGRIAS